jgi:hypothetical protein
MKMKWCLQSHDDSHWFHEALEFYVACPIKLEAKLETNPIEVVCLFHKVLEFVVDDYAMLQQSWQHNIPLCTTKL